MAKDRPSIRWQTAKRELMKGFVAWVQECEHTRGNIPEDMIEFLYQEGFIRGKDWRKFVARVAEKNKGYVDPFLTERRECLREGFIPPGTWV